MASINSNSAKLTDLAEHTSGSEEGTAKKRLRRQVGLSTIANEVKKPKPETPPITKTDAVLQKLKAARGVTLEAIIEATGWQAHSVRGFLSGTVKRKLGHSLISETGKDGIRRYRIADKNQAA